MKSPEVPNHEIWVSSTQAYLKKKTGFSSHLGQKWVAFGPRAPLEHSPVHLKLIIDFCRKFNVQKFTMHFEPCMLVLEAILSGTQINNVWPGFQKDNKWCCETIKLGVSLLVERGIQISIKFHFSWQFLYPYHFLNNMYFHVHYLLVIIDRINNLFLPPSNCNVQPPQDYC